MSAVHVYPNNDVLEHDTDTDECLCGPTVESVPAGEGSFGWLVTHHSMDGREFDEPDYRGSPMVRDIA